MTVLQKKMDAIGIFTQYFALRNNLKLIQISSTDGKLESVTMQKLKTELYVLEQIKKRYVDLISAMELELKMPAKTDHFSSFLEELKTEIGNFEQKLESIPEADQTPAPETEADQTPAAETEGEEMEFVLTSDLYNFIPPTY